MKTILASLRSLADRPADRAIGITTASVAVSGISVPVFSRSENDGQRFGLSREYHFFW